MAINGYEKLIKIMRDQAKGTATSNGLLMIGQVTAQGKVRIGDLVLASDEVEKLSGVNLTANSTILCTFIDDEVYIIGKLQQ